MKKAMFLMITILIFNNLVFGAEINNYPLEVMKTFPNGSGKNELTIKVHYDISYPIGPPCFSFDEEGYLYIVDYIPNKRIIIYDEKINYLDETKGDFYTSLKLEIDKYGNYLTFFPEGLIKLNKEVKIIYEINFGNVSNVYNRTSFKEIEKDTIVFIQLQDKSYISIPNPVVDYKENLKKVLNPEQTINYVNKKLNQKGVPKEERLSMKDGLIFKGDKLMTRDYITFYQYKKEQRIKKGLPLQKKSNITEIPDEFSSSYYIIYYLGEDNRGNTYWTNDSRNIAVLSPAGYTLDYLKYDRTMFDEDPENGMGCQFPVIHPNGDIYFLGYDFTESKLYRIKRRWFSPAVITEKEIKLKNTPSLSDKEIGEPIKKKTEVEVLERNDDKTTIDKKEDYWYKVKTGSNEGWIFGGYMEFVE